MLSVKVGPVVVLLTCVVGLTTGFLPSSFRRTAANLVLPSSGSVKDEFREILNLFPYVSLDRKTITHPDMTRQAILRTVANIYISNPNPDRASSSQDVQRLLDSNKKLDVSKLVDAYYGPNVFNTFSISLPFSARKRRIKKLDKAVSAIGEYNGNVDSDELKNAAAHFDSEQFKAAQNRLIKFRNQASSIIQCDQISDSKEDNNARKFTGRLLHTLQDFYSHTNWIENWIGEVDTISPYRVLGEMDKMIEIVAELTNPCTDCRKVGIIEDLTLRPLYLTILNFSPYVVESSSLYECDENLHSSLKSQKLLTSGYSHGGKDTDDNIIVKPNGKCSHGGIIDGSQDQPAKGGINKDSIHPELASHYRYHEEAANVAQQHSYEFLLSMRNDVNNDQLFGKLLGIEVEAIATSFAAVIDTTLKNSQDLAEIQAMSFQASGNIQQYMPDMAVKYILVPLNDTGKHEYEACVYAW